jgi:hypothetical protein
MSFLQVCFNDIANVMAGIQMQQQTCLQLMDTVKGYVPQVQSVWVGEDATLFSVEVTTRLVPALLELSAAIAGININLTKTQNIVRRADAQAAYVAGHLAEEFLGI